MILKGVEVVVEKGDITKYEVDAIVNAANNKFLMGGGVAGAIKRKGGQVIEDEAVKKGPVRVGESVITSSGSLPSKHVIHAATMAMDFETNSDIIRDATESTLECAQKNNIESLAFCALGCGVGGFPLEVAAKIMGQEVFKYVREQKDPTLKKIIFVMFSDDAFAAFKKNIDGYLGYMEHKLSEGPFVTTDCIIDYQGGVVLIERSNPPFGWAIPGGFVDYGESVEDAVIREMKEETNLEIEDLKQFHTYSQPDRDPRFHTVTVVFTGKGKGTLAADSDAKAAKVFKLDELPENMAFDHRQVLEDYRNFLSK